MGLRKGVPLCVVLVLSLMLLGSPDGQGKPSKPPPVPVDGGTVFYNTAYANSDDVWITVTSTMAPDGSGKTALCEYPTYPPAGRELSRDEHYCAACGQDVRWFLCVLPMEGTDTYPNGIPRGEVFATCTGGHTARLTDAADIEPSNSLGKDHLDTPFFDSAELRWATGDTMVTYLGKRWEDGAVVEWGLYGLEIDPEGLIGRDDSGNLTYRAPEAPMHLDVPVDLTRTIDDLGYPRWHGGRVYSTYDWSPDGAEIVIQRDEYVGLWYGTAPDWKLTLIHTGDVPSYNPRWSPNGGQILFAQNGIWRMDPDPLTNEDLTATQLVVKPATTSRKVYTLDDAFWSPNGTHIIYGLFCHTMTPFKNEGDIYRICADGTGTVNLTGDIDTLPVPIAWR